MKEQDEARKNSEKEKMEASAKQKGQDKFSKYTRDIDILNSGIAVAEKTVSEPLANSSTNVKSGKIDPAKLHLCNRKLEMDIQRKEELTKEK